MVSNTDEVKPDEDWELTVGFINVEGIGSIRNHKFRGVLWGGKPSCCKLRKGGGAEKCKTVTQEHRCGTVVEWKTE